MSGFSMQARLIHPTLDLWLLGGIPLLLILLGPLTAGFAHDALWTLIPYALVLFSYPHFMASYYAFYRQGSVWRKHWPAAVAVPLGLLLVLGILLAWQRDDLLQGLTQITIALLFWHYLKQSYGSCIWLGKMRADGLQSFPRNLLLGTCLLIGCFGFLSIQTQDNQSLVFGMYVKFQTVPAEIQELLRWLSAAGVIACGLYALSWDVRQRTLRASLALLPLFALWVWFEPRFQNPLTLALLPILHGLQYLPFVGRVLWNDLRKQSRRTLVFGGLCLALIAGGFVLFFLLPRQLSGLDLGHLAPASLIFLNIHHYFIDASMWRLSQAEVRERLLQD